MKEKKLCKDDVIKLLLKKANGFYYTEEQLEFEKKEKNNLKTNQVNLFDVIDESKNANLSKKLLNITKNTSNIDKYCENYTENLSNIDYKTNSKKVILNKKYSLKNLVTVGKQNDDDAVMIELSDKINCYSDGENLTLVKKKITSHYVPPDMIAIKILFEIFDKKVDEGGVENMTDDELIKLKQQLLEEIKNENF